MTSFIAEEWEYSKWTINIIPLFVGIIFLGLEILALIVHPICEFIQVAKIPIKGKHLDEFSSTDHLFIFINKLITTLFVYHVLYVTSHTPTIQWKPSELTFSNTIGSLILFYIFYDFVYCNFHRILHLRWVYPWIHKHHHRQKAPSRGNPDAINVHPFEFAVGEYLHLLTVWLIPCHIYTVALFIIIGGVLASLNHTRFDVRFSWFFNVNVHDVHHRIPESNYSQYTMLWDYIQGSYRPYDSVLDVKAE